jgi:hypothetical protein
VDTVGLQDILTLARQESARLHHYFIGVEHLFIALTQLKGGLTVAVLEHHGVSPRFVRYSIRETVGTYEDRRYWPGFPETPRAVEVINLAKRYAGLHTPSERELLLAILDEGDSTAIRVLQEIGVDVAALRPTTANWTAPVRPQPPEVPISGSVQLDLEQRRILQLMFRDYEQVQVVREFSGGYSGARVMLVRPIRVGGYKDAPVVVKLDDRFAVLYERRRYDLHVKGTLPAATARLVDSPIAPDNSSIGGLKYTFVGRPEDTEPVSLREFAAQRDPQAVSDLLHILFETFGPTWWQQRKPYRFGAWREYEHVLPPALVLEAGSDSTLGGTGHMLTPMGAWSRIDHVRPGELVALKGFTVQKVDFEKGVLHLAAGSQPEAINRSSKVEVRGLNIGEGGFYRGEVVDEVIGRVALSRSNLLQRSLQMLEPYFDVTQNDIPSGQDTVANLPNPLRLIPKLLERQVSGSMSSIHGDLHTGNILVGPRGDAWLIDFGWAREGHTLFDWALLEVSLLVEVIAHLAPPGWDGIWGIIGLLDSINKGEDRVFYERHQVGRALTIIATLRELVQECLGVPGRWSEYHIALAFLALRLMDWKSESLDARRLAFLIAALSMAEGLAPTSTGADTTLTDATTDVDQTEIRWDD